MKFDPIECDLECDKKNNPLTRGYARAVICGYILVSYGRWIGRNISGHGPLLLKYEIVYAYHHLHAKNATEVCKSISYNWCYFITDYLQKRGLLYM